MTTFMNPRLSALPCELMLGCIFSDDFVTLHRIADNLGTPTGSGSTADHGLTVDGNGYINYDILYDLDVSPDDNLNSVIIQIKTTVKSTGIIIGNGNHISGSPDTGFSIWTDNDGIKANTGTSSFISDECAVDLDYADGELHTIMFVFNETTDKQSLYVDALDVDIEDVHPNVNSMHYTHNIKIGGDGTNNFIGSIYRARVINAILEQVDHDVYYSDTLTSFIDNPYSCYRCDEFGNDSDGNRIWDRTINLRDLSKADRSASAKFPTFDVDRYTFDLVDDYIDNDEFDLPTEYTITAVKSTPQLPYPEIQQDNDQTFLDLLTVEGQFWGHLHSLIIHDSEISQLQLLHDEYQHLYRLDRGRASGIHHRLITEDVCVMAMYPGSEYDVYRDYSKHFNHGIASPAITRDGLNGVTFDANTAIQVYDDPSLRLTKLNIAFLGDFYTEDPASTGVAGTLLIKLDNYKFSIDIGDIILNGSKIAHTFNNNQMIAVSAINGYKPRFYVDGLFIGEGDVVVYLDDVYENDLFIGSDSVGDPNFTQYEIQQVLIHNQPLTDRENLALYEQAQITGVTSMEAGNRLEVREVFTGVAVDKEIDPGEAFQIIDYTLIFNTLPTTSENCTFKTINASSDESLEDSFDPSLSSEVSQVRRFDKRESAVRKMQIDYPNTDARTITVLVQYQLDQSVV